MTHLAQGCKCPLCKPFSYPGHETRLRVVTCSCCVCQWGDLATDARWALICSDCGKRADEHDEPDLCFYPRFFPGRGKDMVISK